MSVDSLHNGIVSAHHAPWPGSISSRRANVGTIAGIGGLLPSAAAPDDEESAAAVAAVAAPAHVLRSAGVLAVRAGAVTGSVERHGGRTTRCYDHCSDCEHRHAERSDDGGANGSTVR